jgi:uncharacterized protein (TIGR03083 family)
MTEPGQRTMSEILDALEESCQSLASVLADLTPEEWHLPTGCPGWDVQDVASHIIGLEDRFSGVPEPEHTLPEGLAHVRNADGIETEVSVDYRRGMLSEEILRQFRESTTRALQLRRASGRDPEAITDGPFGWEMPYWRLMSIRTFDCFAHEQDIRRAVGRPGNLDGKAARLTEDLIRSLLPGLLGSRLAEFSDQPIAIDVNARPIIASAAGGTATDDTPPATTINMPFSELVAFVCGRADAQVEAVTIEGDETLANQVLRAMAFTP